ncbi:MAG: cupin domain-containing protein [Pseudomonadota bacterium]
MSLPHATSGQLIDLSSGDASHFSSIALVNSPTLEVIRLTLPADKAMPLHKVAGEITFQCLSGCIQFSTTGNSHDLRSGQMIYLAGGELHALLALEDSVALLTIFRA